MSPVLLRDAEDRLKDPICLPNLTRNNICIQPAACNKGWQL